MPGKSRKSTVERSSPYARPKSGEGAGATSNSSSESERPPRNIIQFIPIAPIDVVNVSSDDDDDEIPWTFLRYWAEKCEKESFLQKNEVLEQQNKELQRQNQELEKRLQCSICQDAPLKVTLVPCGHLATCSSCAKPLLECPICRAAITAKQTTFM